MILICRRNNTLTLQTLNSLCIIDDEPRTECSPRTRHTLKEFAAIVMRELELWRDKVIVFKL